MQVRWRGTRSAGEGEGECERRVCRKWRNMHAVGVLGHGMKLLSPWCVVLLFHCMFLQLWVGDLLLSFCYLNSFVF